ENRARGAITNGTRLGEHQWVIQRRVCFCLHDFTAMRQGIAHRSVNLRHAAQRVRILNALAVAVRFANLAALENFAEVLCCFQLAEMWSGLVNALVKSHIGASESIEGEGADDVRGINQDFRCEQRKSSYRKHALRAVNQRN